MMLVDNVDEWGEKFLEFQARFSRFFARREPRTQSRKYIRALLGHVDRKNGWQIAQAAGDIDPLKTQRLLYSAQWDADAVRDELEQFAIQEFGDAEGIGIVDETGFIKKGVKSAGVKRQYSGTAGKIENSQVGVFLGYSSPKGHALLDRSLYLPEEWCADTERRKEAKIPDKVKFATKIDMAVEMLEQAWKNGVPMKWVTADEFYGDAHRMRESIEKSGRSYVLGVSSDARVWAEPPKMIEPFKPGKGRPRTKRHLESDSPRSVTVRQLAQGWPEEKWRRFAVFNGEKGPLTYDWAYERIVESRYGEPGPEGWLLVRRSTSDPADMAYYVSNTPADTAIETLAGVACRRYRIEQCFEEAKGETGLDQYEVRHWHSWYRHITLSMMAHAFMASLSAGECSPPSKMS